MKKTTRMNKLVGDHGNKTNYKKVGKWWTQKNILKWIV
jgi:hypothetical protein